MDNFEAKLCEEVQNYRFLYDPPLKGYKVSIRVQNSWLEIPQRLEIDVDVAKKNTILLSMIEYCKLSEYMDFFAFSIPFSKLHPRQHCHCVLIKHLRKNFSL